MVLSQEQVNKKLQAFRGWEYVDGKITKAYRLSSFMQAVDAINKVAIIAEHADHHPDVAIKDYSQLVITLSTHDAGGVTEKDLLLASDIEKLMAVNL